MITTDQLQALSRCSATAVADAVKGAAIDEASYERWDTVFERILEQAQKNTTREEDNAY